MAYTTYITDALVCGSKDNNTSDRSYLLFTKEAGMLWASARSVREERSKQRSALQDFSLIRVSLVKGKSGWRIGSVEGLGNVFLDARDRSVRTSVTQIIKLLRRLLHGEEVNKKVYRDTLDALREVGKTNETEISSLLDIFTLRILYHLGYIAEHEDYRELLLEKCWFNLLKPLPSRAHRVIKQGLEASHL